MTPKNDTEALFPSFKIALEQGIEQSFLGHFNRFLTEELRSSAKKSVCTALHELKFPRATAKNVIEESDNKGDIIAFAIALESSLFDLVDIAYNKASDTVKEKARLCGYGRFTSKLLADPEDGFCCEMLNVTADHIANAGLHRSAYEKALRLVKFLYAKRFYENLIRCNKEHPEECFDTCWKSSSAAALYSTMSYFRSDFETPIGKFSESFSLYWNIILPELTQYLTNLFKEKTVDVVFKSEQKAVQSAFNKKK